MIPHPTVEAYFLTLNSNDKEGWLDTFSADADYQDPAGTPWRHGRAELGQAWDQLRGLFDTVVLIPGEAYPGPTELALTFLARGRGKNGKEVEFRGIDLFEFDEQGKIRRMRGFWDAAPILGALIS